MDKQGFIFFFFNSHATIVHVNIFRNASWQIALLYFITAILISVDEITVIEIESIQIKRQAGYWTDILQDLSPSFLCCYLLTKM